MVAAASRDAVATWHHVDGPLGWDKTVEVPQPRWIVTGVIAEIEVGGAVKSPVRRLQPNWLIYADTIATHGAPQKRKLTHPGSFAELLSGRHYDAR